MCSGDWAIVLLALVIAGCTSSTHYNDRVERVAKIKLEETRLKLKVGENGRCSRTCETKPKFVIQN